MSKTIKIGGIYVDPCTKKSGLLTIGKKSALRVDLPFTVINGASPGPVLSITAGNHGCEYTGEYAAIKLCSEINADDTNGTLIVVPIVNMPAFQARTNRVCPIDGININRVYPGKPMGTMSYLIAYAIFNEFVLKADFAIDLHGGDLFESIIPHIVLHKSDNEALNEKLESLAGAYAQGGGIEYIWETGEKIGGVGEDVRQMIFPRGTLTAEAVERGIPAITAEAGHNGRLEEKYVSVHMDGILNVMKSFNMAEGKMKTLKVKPKVVRQGAFLYTKHGGIFHLFKEPGTTVLKGEVLGEMRDICDKTVEKITAPANSVILCVQSNPVKNVGDKLLLYAEV